MACKHTNFSASVKVVRLEDTGRFMAEVRIKCEVCGEPFQFLGLEAGLDMQGARVSIDGLEALMSIAPNSQVMSPLQRLGAAARGAQ
ncbi:MAG: hypothetical protein GYB53_14660 [Rhodobacteraceae bacterium]|nr:hypothetical protein [Paracoccaceae bacterium]MBR9819716.1 hypothetical protein [Paracoccaceae bacterium]